jgi:hypothetical protein
LNNFQIRRTFLLPLGILLVLSLVLFVTVIVQGKPVVKVVLLGMMIMPISGLFLESFFRRIHFDDESITVFKPLRKKSLKFSELTEVETLQVKKRVFPPQAVQDNVLGYENALKALHFQFCRRRYKHDSQCIDANL